MDSPKLPTHLTRQQWECLHDALRGPIAMCGDLTKAMTRAEDGAVFHTSRVVRRLVGFGWLVESSPARFRITPTGTSVFEAAHRAVHVRWS